MTFFHTHVHSHYSVLDAMTPVADLVHKAHRYSHPAMGLTDHGVMSGSFQLYKECRSLDMLPFPGLEAYVVDDVDDKTAKRYHLTLLSFTTEGYKFLVRLSSLSHQRGHYHFKPRLGILDLIQAAGADPKGAAGVACLTGCFFGWLMQHYGDQSEGKRAVDQLRAIFPATYVELQHHNTQQKEGPDDDEALGWLMDVAEASSSPVILTQDCHYCDKSEGKLHDRMKMLAYGGADPGDVGFPGDSYHLSTASWVRSHVSDAVWEAALPAYDDLMSKHTLSIPTLDNYSFHVPQLGKADPQAALAKECDRALKDANLASTPKYVKRLEYELDVIQQLSFAPYFHLVADYCQWSRDQGISINARGSANGSLVCWLMGITDVDPIAWRLSFDRFLTIDRERPPDIDLDVEDTRRHEVIDYLKAKHDVVQIGTYHAMSANEEGGGSIFVSWISSRRRALDHETFQREYGGVRNLWDMKSRHPEELRELDELAEMNLLKSPSAHAAGFVMSAPTLKVGDWIPTMLIPSSDTTVTQMTMDDVEDAGFVKIDLLGLRSLTTLRMATQLVADRENMNPDEVIERMPLNDAKVFTFLRKGIPDNGVFQMEGKAAAQGCRQLGVRRIEDLVLVNALYRPAARDAGYTESYLKRRKKLEPVPTFHPVFDKHLKPTLGVPAFQEQVLDIMRDLGMPAAEVNSVLKAIKGKHGGADSSTYFDAAYSKFVTSCAEAGLDEDQTDHAWDLVEGFSRYGFNRAHAVAYSLLGYRLAWLKVNFPLEFHTALLATTAGTKKEILYAKEARRSGVRLLPPDVNISGMTWTIDRQRNAIRRGLVSIDGVGMNAAEEVWGSAPYESMDDLIERTHSRIVTGGKEWAKSGLLKGVLVKLREAGALRSLGVKPEGES